ncbi:MAG: pyridinium-3,5-biscarboxylic acid mononucleotide sulfurtransferase [Halanaerobiales bacterium]|nr:pyridinium-3,5-biscarboxylic acid mononucleotide sulfurtransferase [Halanaerobiales bacterium]
MNVKGKYNKLIDYLKSLDSLVVAFSGGVDSSFLLRAAKNALGDKVVAFTITSPYHPQWEIQEAAELAKKIGVKQVIKRQEIILPEIRSNPPDRCYLCKKALFTEILKFAGEQGFKYVADGTNVDDTKDYRPGMKALKELNIKSPLLETGFTKEDIRAISKEIGLPTWNKPAYACLLSRIPYGQEIIETDLRKIEKAELYMMRLGFKTIRVRLHGDLARIEVSPEERERLFNTEFLDRIAENIKSFGFKYATLDLEGYRTGSLNEVL